MGCNYYLLPDTKGIRRVLKELKNGQLGKYIYLSLRYHVGKSSIGWRFIFDHNDWKDYNNIFELKEFMAHHVLIDEYLQEHNPTEFWGFVESKQHLKQHRHAIKKDGYDFDTGFS
jgi:hypothetical protein